MSEFGGVRITVTGLVHGCDEQLIYVASSWFIAIKMMIDEIEKWYPDSIAGKSHPHLRLVSVLLEDNAPG